MPGGQLGRCPRAVLAAELPRSPVLQSQRSSPASSEGFCLEPGRMTPATSTEHPAHKHHPGD